MARTSKAMAVLVKREAALQEEARALTATLEGVQRTLETVHDLRREMQSAAPKRTRAKRLVPANTQPATATAA